MLSLLKKKIELIIVYIIISFSIFSILFNFKSQFGNLITGRYLLFHIFSFTLSLFVFSCILIKKERYFSFLLIDFLIICFGGVVLATYNFHDNLSPEKLFFAIQLFVWWFLMRFVLAQYSIKHSILFLLIVIGNILTIWGLLQLFDFLPSQNILFKTTGSFFNPGPYAGFLATILPITLSFRYQQLSNNNKWLKNYLIISLILYVLILPATMSRASWIASILGCTLVIFLKRKAIIKVKIIILKNKRKIILLSLFAILLGIFSSLFIFNLKKDSANGRLFMWKITTKAISENSLKGTGLGSFPSKYAFSQIDYFKIKGTDNERRIAGSPEYAFNEYLQLCLEQGILGLLIYITIIIVAVFYSIKNRLFGITGSIVSLSVFSLFSYPYQLPSFLILLVILLASSINYKTTANSKNILDNKWILTIFLSTILTLSSLSLFKGIVYANAYSEWEKQKLSYDNKKNEVVFNELYSRLHHNPFFIFQYAKVLRDNKRYKKSNKLLKRGLQLSSDPMFYNIMARNYQNIQEFNKAEKCLLTSLNLLPERIYPYYLMTKLYATPKFYNSKKLKKVTYHVLNKKPKIYSPAIQQMRDSVKKISNLK